MKYDKILIINIFGIGDVLFTTPLIKNLKLENPSISIGYMCNKRALGVLESNPCINKFHIYERDEFHQESKKSKAKYFNKAREFFKEIKREEYQAVIDISLNTYMGSMCRYAGILKRVGFNYKNRGKFLTNKVDLLGYQDRHVLEHYLDLLTLLDVPIKEKEMELHIPQEDTDWADGFRRENSLENKPIVGIVPGGGASWGKEAYFKRWSSQNYAKLADYLIEKYGAGIILFGDKTDVALCQEVQEKMTFDATLACGKATITQFASLSQKCNVVVVNDGGPLHICVAAKAKTVSIFGPVDHNVYGPYPKDGHEVVVSDIVCRPCYRNFRKADCTHLLCLKTIEVQHVCRKVEQFL